MTNGVTGYSVTCIDDIKAGAYIDENLRQVSNHSYESALKADDKKNGGNGNRILDESEISVFNMLSRASDTGIYASQYLNNLTYADVYETVRINLHNIVTTEYPEVRNEAIRDFFKGYNNNPVMVNGFFEQAASEWGMNMTNGEVTAILEAVLESIPEGRERYCDEYRTVYDAWQTYSQKPADKKFKNSPVAFITRIFGADRLDNLDEAIKKLYK